MNTKIILNSIIITLFSVLFFSCNKESKCTGVNYSYLTESQKSNTFSPYHGSDTLLFLYNNKDTQIYVGQGAQSGWQLVPGGDPSLCDSKYENLVYTYNCINAIGFTFRLEYHPHGILTKDGKSMIYANYSFKNVNVGEYQISKVVNDTININGVKYYEPYYWTNGPDTAQYFMFNSRTKGPSALILKIKYLNNELTLIK